MPAELSLRKIGPIEEAEVEFGDFTVLVGPQATGKSILLQFLKLLLDTGPVLREFKKSGLDWQGEYQQFFDVYFGEGMRSIWSGRSQVGWKGRSVDVADLVSRRRSGTKEKVFIIPAQRILALSRDGWLRPFTDYRAGDPFTVRDFSEKLRMLMDSGLGRGEAVFPQQGRLKAEIREMLDDTVFRGYKLRVEPQGPQKRLVLSDPADRSRVPFMVWSAGQREMVPLLLGLYWLMPSTRVARRGSIQWVVIEELEMGLHPKAIGAVLMVVLDLLWRGYRVCLSTHSSYVLDVVWALRRLRESGGTPRSVLRLFGAKETPQMLEVGKAALRKSTKVYYFDQKTRTARDISALDPGSSTAEEAGWGGLTEFSGLIADEVARVAGGNRR